MASSLVAIVSVCGLIAGANAQAEARFSPVDGSLSFERTVISTPVGALSRFSVHLTQTDDDASWLLKNARQLPQIPDERDYAEWIPADTGVFLKKSGVTTAAEWFDVHNGQWQTLPTLPAPRQEAAFAAWNGKIYAFGGVDTELAQVLETQEYAGDVLIYDPAAASWSTGASMPSPLLSPSAVVLGDKIYVLSGYTFPEHSRVTVSGMVRIYDPRLDRWEEDPADLPASEVATPFGSYLFHPLGDKLLIIQYYAWDVPEPARWRIYDPATGTVQDLLPPKSQHYFASAEVDGIVYLFVTRDNSMLAYDPRTDNWEVLSGPPETLSARSVGTALNGELYVFDLLFQRASVYVYNPATRTWRIHYTRSLQPARGADVVFDAAGGRAHLPVLEAGTREMPQRYRIDLQLLPDSAPPRFRLTQAEPLPAYAPPRFYPAAGVVHDDAIYLLGGNHLAHTMSAVQRFDTRGYRWDNAATLPFPRRVTAAAVLAGEIYVLGGSTGTSGPLARVDVFDPAAGTWRDAAALPGARYELAAAALDDKIYAGGGVGTGQYLADFQVYDPNSDTWETAPALPAPRASGSLAALAGALYYSGGRAPRDDIDEARTDDTSEARAEVFRLEPGGTAWHAVAPMPGPLFGHFSAAYADELYVTGGRPDYLSDDLTSLWIYSPNTDTWRSATPTLSLSPFDSAGLFATANGLFLAGVDDNFRPRIPLRLLRYNAEVWEPVYFPFTDTGSAGVEYQAQVENSGWSEWMRDGKTAGTTGQSRRLEGLRLVLRDLPQCGLRYRVSSPSQGWSEWARDGRIATGAPAEPMESLQVTLEPDHCESFLLEYRVRLQTDGWLEWVYDGISAGVEGSGKRIEAVAVRVRQP